MKKDKELDWGREEALKRFSLIAPLMEEDLPGIEKARRKTVLLSEKSVSERTLRRWLAAYRQGGFDALVPKERKDKGSCRAISPEVLALAEECRKELPRRSAGLIRDWLKTQGYTVARSTLERHLRQNGLSGRALKAQAQKAGHRRFARIGRCSLFQTDIKYGPYIPDPKHPAKKIRTYLLVIIDDATRMVAHAEFYDNQKLPILEDVLRKAIQKCGSPKALYADNGKIFISTWLKLACGRLNIRLLNTKPYSPESKGKVERFNRTVEQFISEVALQKPQSLKELNEQFRIWLSEGYHHQPHSAIGGKTPAEAFAQDTTPLRFHTLEALQDAFLWEAERTVDKSGCLKLEGQVYEAGIEYLRKKVILRYDPFDLSVAQLWYRGQKAKLITPLQIGESNHVGEKTLKHMEVTSESRILKAYAQEHQRRFRRNLGAFSLRQEVSTRV
ncbi:integrase [Megasphaera cerevisiae DSM 20462]|uniref:Integrase n=1 Tax=Megasphaera cerevisiae DSM 20462 TaxID=1122219 RepID=A0A0J6WUY1_9FIRM|nr:IS481 family transposase [Megasphaera cerevisiae]KMO85577.1 integrase [Megasphaera cerevisiae DSM 20462]SKA14638.1 Homeodomain-like domain-containing protein [Megasphaera cerevisiae DSM 20462]